MKFLPNKMQNLKNSLFSKIKKASQNSFDPTKTAKKPTSQKSPVSKIKSPNSKPQSTRLKKTSPKKQKCVNDTKSSTTSLAWRSTSTGNLTITWWTKTSTSWAMKETKTTEGWWASMKWSQLWSNSKDNWKCFEMSSTKHKISVKNSTWKIMSFWWSKRTNTPCSWQGPKISWPFHKSESSNSTKLNKKCQQPWPVLTSSSSKTTCSKTRLPFSSQNKSLTTLVSTKTRTSKSSKTKSITSSQKLIPWIPSKTQMITPTFSKWNLTSPTSKLNFNQLSNKKYPSKKNTKTSNSNSTKKPKKTSFSKKTTNCSKENSKDTKD